MSEPTSTEAAEVTHTDGSFVDPREQAETTEVDDAEAGADAAAEAGE